MARGPAHRALGAIGVAGAPHPHSTVRDDEYKLLRLITAVDLIESHTASLSEPDSEQMELTASLAILSEARVGVSWNTHHIPPRDYGKTSLTPFEKQAIKRIQAGSGEIAERNESGKLLYARPVRMQKVCAFMP